MDTVDTLYDLIKKDPSIKTFEDNKELFQRFFFSGMSIEFDGPKVKDLMLYLLKVNPDEYDFPFLKLSIFKAFYMYEQHVTQSTYSKGEDLSSKVDEIKDLIEFYNQLRSYDQEEKYLKNSIFVRDYTGAMIVLLNNTFFEMENDDIKYCVEHIKNNAYIKEIINGNNGKGFLDKDYVFQYFSRFLFTTEFVNIDNVDNDVLLNSLLEGKIKDIDFVKSAYKHMNISFLVDYDKPLDKIISGLDNITDDELKKKEISTIIINKLIDKDEYYYLFKYYINHLDTDLLDDENKKDLITRIARAFPPELDEEDVKFLLTQNLGIMEFRNLKIKMQTENWSDDIKEKINNACDKFIIDDVPFETAIRIMKDVFSEKQEDKKFNIYDVMRALTTIIKTYLNDDSVKVFFVLGESYNGCANPSLNEIRINLKGVNKLLKYKGPNDYPDKLSILETIFHESKHIMQFFDMTQNGYTDKELNQYKEKKLRIYNTDYYSDNYRNISYENEAREYGAGTFVYFLKEFFPEMEKAINYYTKKMLEEQKEQIEERKIFELSNKVTVDEAFDKLVSINPSIIKKDKILIQEYNLDGTKKEDKRKGELK